MEDDSANANVDTAISQRRAPKPTESAKEDKLLRLRNRRQGKLSLLTRKMHDIQGMKAVEDNVEIIKTEMSHSFHRILCEFKDANDEVIQNLPEEEREDDQSNWYDPKCEVFEKFMAETEQWITETCKGHPEEDLNNAIRPQDSVSVTFTEGARSKHSSTARSTTSSARAKAKAEHAALLARADALKKRQEIDAEVAKLQAKREDAELEADIAASTARLKVLNEYEENRDDMSGHHQPHRNMNRTAFSDFIFKEERKPVPQPRVLVQTPGARSSAAAKPIHGSSNPQSSGPERELHRIMQRQNEVTELLVMQQSLSQLPQRAVPVFSGDPLEYRSFMRAFESAIETKTKSDQDRLFYLEQYTSGEPRDLVRSCEHMRPDKGLKEAKRLLQYHYGNELKIATAYLDKALKWPQIKTEDAKGLKTYALYLTGCRNTMTDIDFMEEMDNPSNMRTVLSKLPYKLRERWRNTAFDFQVRHKRRARFEDLVAFIDLHAQVMNDPLFGDIQDVSSDAKAKPKPAAKSAKKSDMKGANFATGVSPVVKESTQPVKKKEQQNTVQSTDAAEKTCLFCEKAHTLSSCDKFKEQEYTERIQFLKSKGLCYGCLNKGHLSKDCKRRLTCAECAYKHPTVLHKTKEDSGSNGNATANSPTVSNALLSLDQESCASTGAGDSECILSVVPVKVKSKRSDKTVKTFAFLDPGSTTTFCTEDLMHKLNVRGKKTDFLLCTLGQQKKTQGHVITDLEVCALEGTTYIDLPRVLTQQQIPVKKGNIPKQQDLSKWPYLSEVRLPPLEADVGLLIGVNAYKAMEPWKVLNSRDGGPYAVQTALGWSVMGPRQDSTSLTSDTLQTCISHRISVENIEDLLVQQFNTDFPERRYEDKTEMSQEDRQFMRSVTKSLEFKGGHYHIGLPLKDEKIQVPDNKCVAMQRLLGLKRKLTRNPQFHSDYTGFMDSILDKGYAERVPEDELQPDGVVPRVWYIPHHGVYHPKKNKIRVVFDCNVSYQGFSLNGQLLQGPNLTNTLLGVLNRFRRQPFAIMADIESMFYQVRVQEKDADLLRFLWWPEGSLEEETVEYRMCVHLFGATSSPSCSCFALRRIVEDQQNETTEKATQTLLTSFYVDDCLTSVETEQEAITLARDLISLCSKGGFKLTKWMSNSRAFLSSVPEQERAIEVKTLDLDSGLLPVERALGVTWCTETDTFSFNINVQNKPATRRGILSVVGSVYDPLGFLSPFVLPAKLLLRDLCKERRGWDEEITENHLKRWTRWTVDLQKLSSFRVNRCFKPASFGAVKTAQLHNFSDASEDGYGTVTYLVMTNEHDEKSCSFVMAKSRVAPLKQITVPRMELTAATVAVKMDRMLKQELDMELEESLYWTDSMTVLKYIENDAARYKTFVANRVSLIREASKPSQWRYVNSPENPADHVSRGLTTENLMRCENWIEGPSFLLRPCEEWPVRTDQSSSLPVDDPEIKRNAVSFVIRVEKDESALGKLIAYYSDWHHLKKAVAWFTHLKKILLDLSHKRAELQKTSSASEGKQQAIAQEMKKYKKSLKDFTISVEDLTNAEHDLIRYSQQLKYGEEIKTLLQGKHQVRKSSHIYKLDPYLDEGVLRVGGRLCRAAMPEEAKHPAILHTDLKISRLILQHTHRQVGHCGRNHVLAKLRQKYWIPHANSAIRKMISNCYTCRKLYAKVGEQKMADLPVQRLTPDNPPFTFTGVDYFGPLQVKRGRAMVKRYGVLFTCLTMRAVHIEVAHSLDTDACINALRRFISRRGQVSVIRSDNGTNFIGAERELREAIQNLNDSKIKEEMLKGGIEWNFNPPGASHQGGIWERQIRTVRKVLAALLKQQVLDDDGLHTLLCEVESIINSRPLTKLSEDPNDLEPLTPNHLLLIKAKPAIPPGIFDRSDVYGRRRWRQIQYLSDLFWHRWTKEYLPLLQERQRWSKVKRNFEVNDIVLIVDPSGPRSSWMLGRIVKTMPDSRGQVRSVQVQTKTSVLERPITKLCLLQEAV